MKMLKRTALGSAAIAALLLGSGAALAEDDDWKNYTVDDGLPANEIQLVESADGDIWIGTLKGLVKFNDGEFSAEPIVKHSVFDLLDAGDRGLLVGTNRGAVAIKDGKVGQPMLRGNYVAPFLRVSDDRVWALKRKGGQDAEINILIEWVDGEWREVEALADRSVVNMYNTDDGRFWVTLDGDGIAEFNPDKGFEDFTHHLEGLSVTALFQDSKKRVWAGMWGAGVAMLSEGRWKTYLEEGEPYVFDIVEDNRGDVWISTNKEGLWQYTGDKWKHHLADQGAVNLLEVVRDGTVVISAARVGGLQYWSGEEWKTSLPGPLPIRCLYEASDGTLFAGGILDGLHVLPPGK